MMSKTQCFPSIILKKKWKDLHLQCNNGIIISFILVPHLYSNMYEYVINIYLKKKSFSHPVGAV